MNNGYDNDLCMMRKPKGMNYTPCWHALFYFWKTFNEFGS